jgi:cytochrome c oxidase cbb3-type subunit 3
MEGTMAEPTKQDRLLDHQYDGIAEYDNPMPGWWVISFWATIVFAIAYALNIGGIGTGPGRIAEYERTMADARKAHPPRSGFTAPAVLLAIAADHEKVEKGKELFVKTCAPCHAADGGGVIGPNLTDDHWIHGGAIEQINATITNGVPAKGMPEWGKMLKPADVDLLTAYVWTLQGTTPAKPKPPEGEVYKR